MRKIRSSHTVARIDKYIAEHYPEEGPDAVAETLGEPKQYIQERAWKNHIRYTKRNTTTKNRTRRTSAKDTEIKRLKTEVRKLQIALIREKNKNKQIAEHEATA